MCLLASLALPSNISTLSMEKLDPAKGRSIWVVMSSIWMPIYELYLEGGGLACLTLEAALSSTQHKIEVFNLDGGELGMEQT